MIRFTIDLDETWRRTIRCQRGGGWELPARPLVEQPATHWSGQPAEPGTRWYQGPSLTQLRKAAETLVTQPAGAAKSLAPRLARFLFDALLGDDDWKSIGDYADQVGRDKKEEIELAFRITIGRDTAPEVAGQIRLLHGLPWELICAVPNAGQRLLTVTRLVASGGVPAPLSWPPRILFVLSTRVTDEELRPATEAMGMMSYFEMNEAQDITRILRPELQLQVLENATVDSLKKAVRSFRPEIVYFICHGRAGELILNADPEHKTPTATTLVGCFAQDGIVPSLVVLAACESASMAGPHVSGSLAAELVAGGIPIVIGMAGKISSVGCRLFTRSLAESLFQRPDRSLSEALCLARAVARQSQNPHEPAEWALPTTFMADNDATANYHPVSAGAIERRARCEARARQLGLIDKYNPVFCCREKLVRTYEQVMRGAGITVVLAHADGPLLGKSRALREVGIWALRDGHIPFPVMLSKDRGPTTKRELGLALLDAIGLVQAQFQLEPDRSFAGKLLRKLADNIATVPPEVSWLPKYDYREIVAKVREHAASQPQPNLTLIRAAFGHDAEVIHGLIVRKYVEDFRGNDSRALLLLDNADKYLALFQELLASDSDMATLGFGENHKIPVFAALQTSKQNLNEFAESHWVESVELAKFPSGPVGELAYERILLHPYDVVISEVPLCFKPGQTEVELNKWRKSLYVGAGGVPGELVGEDRRMHSTLQMIRDHHGMLVPADDPSLVREFVRARELP